MSSVSQEAQVQTKGRPSRKPLLVTAPLLVLLVLWLWLFVQEGAFSSGPNGKTLAADMAMFVTASRVLGAGDNPYDPNTLYSRERTWLRGEHITHISRKGVVRVGNPPLFFWLLGPTTRLPFSTVGWASVAALLVLAGFGFVCCLRYMGWSSWVAPLTAFLMMPPVVLAAYYANVVALLFAIFSAALLLVRERPLLAGVLLTSAWLKPQVALPAAGLIVLFLCADRRRVILGFAGASLLLLAITAAACGPHSVVEWVRGLTGYSRDIATSPSIASLSGLYVRRAPATVRTGLEVLSLLIAAGLTFFAWRRWGSETPVPVAAIAWLWLVWFLATPYGHFFDEILLAVPFLALLGSNGRRIGDLWPAVAVYLAFFSLLFISWAPGGVQLLSIPLLAVAWIAWRRSVGATSYA